REDLELQLREATLDVLRTPDEQRAEHDAFSDERHGDRGEDVGGDVAPKRPWVARPREAVDHEGARADRPPGRALAGPNLTADGGGIDAGAVHALDVIAPRLLLEDDERQHL